MAMLWTPPVPEARMARPPLWSMRRTALAVVAAVAVGALTAVGVSYADISSAPSGGPRGGFGGGGPGRGLPGGPFGGGPVQGGPLQGGSLPGGSVLGGSGGLRNRQWLRPAGGHRIDSFGHGQPCAALAQSAERLTRNEKVRGSIPRGGSERPVFWAAKASGCPDR